MIGHLPADDDASGGGSRRLDVASALWRSAEAGRGGGTGAGAAARDLARFRIESARKGSTGMTQAEHRSMLLNQNVMLEPAAAGASGMQADYRRGADCAGRAGGAGAADCVRERGQPDDGASGGAGARDGAAGIDWRGTRGGWCNWCWWRARWLALLAAAAGALFAVVVGAVRGQQDQSAGQSGAAVLPADWRVLAFGLALTVAGDAAVRAGARAARVGGEAGGALKGGEDPHSRRRLMHALIAMQVAFCFLVLFVAGLFAATFDRLSHRPTGFFGGAAADAGGGGAARAIAGGVGPGGGASAHGAGRGDGGAVGMAAAEKGRRGTASSRSTARLRVRRWRTFWPSRRVGGRR